MNRFFPGPEVRNLLAFLRLFLKSSVPALMIYSYILLVALLSPSTGAASGLFRIGTGGPTGVYYPIGKLIAEGLTQPAEEKGTPGARCRCTRNHRRGTEFCRLR